MFLNDPYIQPYIHKDKYFCKNKINWFLSLFERLYILKNRLYPIKYSLKSEYLRKQLHNLYVIPQGLIFYHGVRIYILILGIHAERLLTIFDKNLSISLALSISCNL